MMTKNKLSAKAEASLMGFVQSVDNENDLKFILEYAKKSLNATFKVDEVLNATFIADEVLKDEIKSLDDYEVKTVVFNKIYDMRYITITLKTPDEEFDILNENGVFSYAYNIDCPIYSDLGYSYFKRIGNDIVNVG